MSNFPIVILGAGPGGLCMAARLKQEGFSDLVIVEKADDLGGTWYHNRYPGCECDIPSFLYSFSFEPKGDWSKPYGRRGEILSYLDDFATKYDLRRHCRFGDAAVRARWNEADASWTIDLASGATVAARAVVSAIGMFNDLAWPEIEGFESFAGASFHSARWNEGHDLTGEAVAVVGSAASAVQLVPEIVKQARQVHLFQRTANWVMPKQDDPFTEEMLAFFADHPEVLGAARQEIFDQVDAGLTFSDPEAVADIEAQCLENMAVVEDPEVHAKLRPEHPFGCKRPLLSNDYYPAFNRENLELVTDGIERIEPSGVRTVDGRLREVDTLVFATGFQTTRYLSAIDVVGRGGQRIEDAWRDEGAAAYLGITASGFPNLFMLYGPNTNNGSLITMIEFQVEYAVRKIAWIASEGLAWIDVRPEVMKDYNAGVDEAMLGVKPWHAGCNGYYRSPSGRIVTQWPGTMGDYGDRTGADDRDAFEVAKG